MEIHSFICDKCKDEIHINMHQTIPEGWAILTIFKTGQNFHICPICIKDIASTFQPFVSGNEYKP